MSPPPNPMEMPLLAAALPPDQEGERAARTLYRENLSYVWNTLRRLGIMDADREDLCHDVFAVFFRGSAAYDPARPLKPWLFGIAFRVASDHRRRARFRRELPGQHLDHASDTPLADDALVQKESRQIVERALASLDLDQRAVFILHEIDGLAMPQIAEVLDAPLNTLYSRLRLARQKFTVELKRHAAREAEPPAVLAQGGRR